MILILSMQVHRNRSLLKRPAGLAVLFALLAFSCLQAGAEISEADRALTRQVFSRLLAVAPSPSDIPWPPTLDVVDKDEINAFAAIRKGETADSSVVVCNEGLLNASVEGNADRLAYILGHELAHHLLGHTKRVAGETEFLRATFTREQELTADRRGMELALRAGFSYKSGLTALRRMIELGLNYSSFEGLSADHPSWLDRIAQLDKEQAGLWRSMSSFDNGVYFLLVQNYPLAERSFRQVTGDFPDSWEAWSNLGFAQLMQYADALSAEDLLRFDVGQIVTGGFYRRPTSLEDKVRGIHEELWVEAVKSLEEALRLKPGLSFTDAGLGVAYLIRPAGRDAAKSVQFLEEAVKLAERDDSLDTPARLAGELNLAVAYTAQGAGEKAMATLSRVEMTLAEKKNQGLRGTGAIAGALRYNRALLLSQSPDVERRKQAIGELESYLRKTGPSLVWWHLAYRRYSSLCKATGRQAIAESTLLSQDAPRFRPVAGLEVGHRHLVLGQSMTEVRGQMGVPVNDVPAVRDASLARLDYPNLGVRLMGTDDLIAITLTGPGAPALQLREMGLGSKATELRVGMTTSELEKAMGDVDYDFRQLVDPELNYRFYSDMGIAVLVKSGRVVELVIGQVPKRRSGI